MLWKKYILLQQNNFKLKKGKEMRRNFFKKASLVVLALATATTLSANQAPWPKEITFGLIPVAGSSGMEEQFGPMRKYLEDKLGIKVKMQVSSDYTGVITGMAHKHIDVAYLGPKSYVEAAKRANADAIAVELNAEGIPGYYGYIISKKGSGLKTIEDLKGKTWAFTDPQSTSGTLVPTVLFSKKGINPQKYFSKVIYSGSHESSILAVKAGKVEAAATNDLDFKRGLGRHWNKDDFNIINVSDLIPGSPMVVRKDLPESLKMALKGAFIAYKPSKESALKSKGYVNGDDAMFDTVRELIKLKNELKKKNK